MRKVNFLVLLILINCSLTGTSQSFKELTLRGDTTIFYQSKNSISYLGENYFFIPFKDSDQLFELTIYPNLDESVASIQIMPSSNVTVVDSLTYIDNKFFRGKIKLKNFSYGNSASLLIKVVEKTKQYNREIKLFPYKKTLLTPIYQSIDSYSGEDKTLLIPVTNPENLNVPTTTIKGSDYDYSMSLNSASLNIRVQPHTTGSKEIVLDLETLYPFINSAGIPTTKLPPYTIRFTVKPSRLNFINTDKTKFFYDLKSASSEEVQLDYKKDLEPGKTYRIENQLEPNGKLIAELYVKSPIGDNKLLCELRSYSYHKTSDGYLYVKQGAEAKYLTNFDILQKPTIENIALLHEGEEWSAARIVYPGEDVQLKIEGTGLLKTNFTFSNCLNIKQDSTRIFDDLVYYSFTVPAAINKKAILIEMNNEKTKYELAIKENRHPKELGFITINYENKHYSLDSSITNSPLMEPNSLDNVTVSFDESKIDTKTVFYGKQYLDFELKLYNSKNDLIEEEKIDGIAICPDESSLRGIYYDRKDCFKNNINVNDYLLHKTYDLEGWSKLEITVRHSSGKYTEPGYSKKIVIIKQQRSAVDLQVSFPAGLLTKSFSTKGIGELSGFSIAFLAEMNFYKKNEVQKLKPYTIGAGFIALNVFNLTATNQQPDVGAVAIGSILPLKPERKLNFPLYLGFGYLLRSGEWFTLLGPGIEFNF